MRITINAMIDIIEDFCKRDDLSSKELIIGGCVGSNILSLCINTAIQFIHIDSLMVVEGCQDYIEIEKTYMKNHVFYGELFTSLCDDKYIKKPSPLISSEPFHVPMLFHDTLYQCGLVIVNDAHLIDSFYIDEITKSCRCKIIKIVDPYDIGGEPYLSCPTLVDSLSVQSPLRAYARKLINVENRFVDTKINSKVTSAKINYRNIGRYNDHQYISTDEELIKDINSRYKRIQRLQKVMITSNNIEHRTTDIANSKTHVYMKNSLGSIMSTRLSNRMYRFKLHNSKFLTCLDLTYEKPRHYEIGIIPANILSVENARYHKYNSSVLILSSKEGCISTRQMYSVLRNTNNLIIGTYEKR